MSTAHNRANVGDIAKVVLMPGDPLRAKLVADKYLEDVVLFNDVRGILGYTGVYKGKKVSVMASGMGMPSIGIYSYELFKYYGVDTIIRIGSAGAYSDRLHLKDIVLTTKCYSESTYGQVQSGDTSKYQFPDYDTNEKIRCVSKSIQIPVVEVCIHSSDVFYAEKGMENPWEFVDKYDALCVEMESFALFHNAKILGKKAACLLTISDNLVLDTHLNSEERQKSFGDMITLALESAIEL